MQVHTIFQKRKISMKIPLVKVIDRVELANFQKDKLNLKNVTIKIGVEVRKIAKNYVLVDNEKIGYSYLVGADGVNSIVRKYLNIKTKNLTMGIQYLIKKTDSFKNYEMFFDPRYFGSSYTWIIPHKNHVVIGIGTEQKFMSTKKLKENFDKWLRLNGIDVSQAKFEAFPINHDYKGHQFGNIFLVGDAAGFSSRLTGEGIYQAIISGEEVAKKIIDNDYESLPIKRILKKKKFHSFLVSTLGISKYSAIIIYEIFSLCLKSKRFVNKLITKGI